MFFHFFDVDEAGFITKVGLAEILESAAHRAIVLRHAPLPMTSLNTDSVPEMDLSDQWDEGDPANTAAQTALAKEIQSYLEIVHNMVDDAFQVFDEDELGGLSFPQFSSWLAATPEVYDMLSLVDHQSLRELC